MSESFKFITCNVLGGSRSIGSSARASCLQGGRRAGVVDRFEVQLAEGADRTHQDRVDRRNGGRRGFVFSDPVRHTAFVLAAIMLSASWVGVSRGEVVGSVVDADGDPVANATVSETWPIPAEGADTRGGYRSTLRGTSDSQGRFRLRTRKRELGTITAVAFDSDRQNAGFVVASLAEAEPVTIVLEPVARLKVRVSWESLGTGPRFLTLTVRADAGPIVAAGWTDRSDFEVVTPRLEGSLVVRAVGAMAVEVPIDRERLDLGTIELQPSVGKQWKGQEVDEWRVTAAREVPAHKWSLKSRRGKWLAVYFWDSTNLASIEDARWVEETWLRLCRPLSDPQTGKRRSQAHLDFVSVHAPSMRTPSELEANLEHLAPVLPRGYELRLPVLFDATGETVRRFGVAAGPGDLFLIDPAGRMHGQIDILEFEACARGGLRVGEPSGVAQPRPAPSFEGAGDLANLLRELSTKIPYLDYTAVLYDRPLGIDRELLTREENAAFDALRRLRHTAAADELALALRDSDPKVRTLALLVAYWSREPIRWLPEIVALAGDQAEAFPFWAISTGAQRPRVVDPITWRSRWITVTRPVGMLAGEIASKYLKASGYQRGIDGDPPRHPGFADYWDARKGREYCLGWFWVEVRLATKGSYPPPESSEGEVRAMRERIDKLPSPDREWTLLSLSTVHPLVMAHAERVAVLKRLGRDRLLALFHGRLISEDPDLQLDEEARRTTFSYRPVVTLALRNAATLFGPEDADLLLTCSGEHRERRESGRIHFVTPLWAIAAADVAPERAGKILRAARLRFADGHSSDDQKQRALIATALWRHLNGGAIAEIADWFFGEVPTQYGDNAGRRHLSTFLENAEQRELLTAILTDDRLDHLDWVTLTQLVRAANRHASEPVVSERELRAARHPYRGRNYYWRRAEAKELYPKETEKLEETLALWRKKLRAFATLR